MDNLLLLAALYQKVENKLKEIPDPSTLKGLRGHQGIPGKDFDFSEHSEEIKGWVKDFCIKFSDLTPEQIQSLKGAKGEDGKPGKDFSIEDHAKYLEDLAAKAAIKFEDLTAEQVESIRGPKGKDGSPGVNGKDFSIEEHAKYLEGLAAKAAIKFEDLTPEQREEIRGTKGKDGKPGTNGKDFSLEEHEKYLEDLASKFALKFKDLSAEDINSLRGVKGEDGKPGKDFNWQEHREKINNFCKDIILDSYEDLKLKFSDLTSQEVETLRGPKGEDGKDFVFEEHKEFFNGLKLSFSDLTEQEVEKLKLRFKDLTSEEKSALKIKFSDLTEDEINNLRGPRGQRGRQGDPGESIQGDKGDKGDKGNRGEAVRGDPGPPGIKGRDGQNGNDGNDGQDAPFITDVRVDQTKDEIEFVFEFSDGSEIRTDSIKLPQGNSYVALGGGGGGGGGSSGSEIESVNGQTGIVVLDKSDIGLPEVDDTSDLDKPISDDTQSALDLKIDLSEKGLANGVAELDAGAKILLSQLPDSILGQLEYQGTWNATTNTPSLTDPDPTAHGHYYVVSNAASRFGEDYQVGDWAINNNGSWEKVDNTDAVSTVFGRLGNILPVAGDYNASQITNTPAGNISAATAQDAINELDSEKQPVDQDLTDIAALTPSNDDFLQRKAGAWTKRTPAQVKTDLNLSGTNSGDQIAATVANTPAGNIASATVQGAINELDSEKADAGAMTTALSGKQPVDQDLTDIAGIVPSDDDIIQRKAGAWVKRTVAQFKSDLALTNASTFTFGTEVVGATDLVAGKLMYLPITYSGIITGWKISTEDETGSAVFDIWKNSSFPTAPTVTDTIINTGAGGVKPTLSSAKGSVSSSVSNWTASFTAGDYFVFKLDSTSGLVKRAKLQIFGVKT